MLNGVRGLDVINDRLYSQVGVRGVNRLGDYGGRLLVTINGHRMNDSIYEYSNPRDGRTFRLQLTLRY